MKYYYLKLININYIKYIKAKVIHKNYKSIFVNKTQNYDGNNKLILIY